VPFYEDNGDHLKSTAPASKKKAVIKKTEGNEFDLDEGLELGDQSAAPTEPEANVALMNGAEKEAKMSERTQAMMGLDEEDMTREREIITMTEAMRSEREVFKQSIAKGIENTVDLGYYALNNDAFHAVLPVIEVKHF
jgi:hypothetical protein